MDKKRVNEYGYCYDDKASSADSTTTNPATADEARTDPHTSEQTSDETMADNSSDALQHHTTDSGVNEEHQEVKLEEKKKQ